MGASYFLSIEKGGRAAVETWPPLCSPSDAASQTCVGLTSSMQDYSRRSRPNMRNGMPQLPDQEKILGTLGLNGWAEQ